MHGRPPSSALTSNFAPKAPSMRIDVGRIQLVDSRVWASTCGIACVECGAGDGNRTHVTSLEGWRTTIVLRPLVVARRGFEPLISGLEGRRPSPLDERAARTDSARKRWQFVEVRSRAPCARPATNERRAKDYCRPFALRIRRLAARGSNPCPPACQAGS